MPPRRMHPSNRDIDNVDNLSSLNAWLSSRRAPPGGVNNATTQSQSENIAPPLQSAANLDKHNTTPQPSVTSRNAFNAAPPSSKSAPESSPPLKNMAVNKNVPAQVVQPATTIQTPVPAISSSIPASSSSRARANPSPGTDMKPAKTEKELSPLSAHARLVNLKRNPFKDLPIQDLTAKIPWKYGDTSSSINMSHPQGHNSAEDDQTAQPVTTSAVPVVKIPAGPVVTTSAAPLVKTPAAPVPSLHTSIHANIKFGQPTNPVSNLIGENQYHSGDGPRPSARPHPRVRSPDKNAHHQLHTPTKNANRPSDTNSPRTRRLSNLTELARRELGESSIFGNAGGTPQDLAKTRARERQEALNRQIQHVEQTQAAQSDVPAAQISPTAPASKHPLTANVFHSEVASTVSGIFEAQLPARKANDITQRVTFAASSTPASPHATSGETIKPASTSSPRDKELSGNSGSKPQAQKNKAVDDNVAHTCPPPVPQHHTVPEQSNPFSNSGTAFVFKAPPAPHLHQTKANPEKPKATTNSPFSSIFAKIGNSVAARAAENPGVTSGASLFSKGATTAQASEDTGTPAGDITPNKDTRPAKTTAPMNRMVSSHLGIKLPSMPEEPEPVSPPQADAMEDAKAKPAQVRPGELATNDSRFFQESKRSIAALRESHRPVDREHVTWFGTYGAPDKREGAPSGPRKVYLENLPASTEIKQVTELVFGGIIESIALNDTGTKATVVFVHQGSCKHYSDATANGIPWPADPARTIFVTVDPRVMPVNTQIKSAIEHGITRIVRAVGNFEDLSIREIKGFANRVVGITATTPGTKDGFEHIWVGEVRGVPFVEFAMPSVNDAVLVSSTMRRSVDWEKCNIKWRHDPCARATGVHKNQRDFE